MNKNYKYKKDTILGAIAAICFFSGEYYLTVVLEPYLKVSVILVGAISFSIVSLLNAFAWRNNGYNLKNLDKISMFLLSSVVLLGAVLLFISVLFIYYGDGFI